MAEWLTGFVGLWAILDLVIRPDKKHDLHSELRAKFIVLAAKLQQSEHTKQSLSQLTTQRLDIEQDEPPCKRLVDLEARNEEIRARNWTLNQIVPLSRAQRMWGYYATWGLRRLEDWQAGVASTPRYFRRFVIWSLERIMLVALGASAAYFVQHSEYAQDVLLRIVNDLTAHK